MSDGFDRERAIRERGCHGRGAQTEHCQPEGRRDPEGGQDGGFRGRNCGKQCDVAERKDENH